jgi:hypothetical protein
VSILMFFFLALLSGLFLDGCGKVEVSGRVEHVITVDFDKLEAYFKDRCIRDGAINPEVCAGADVADFLKSAKH